MRKVASTTGRRTVKALLALVEAETKQVKMRQAAAAEAQRIANLHELAIYQGTEPAFQAQLQKIRERYAQKWSLLDRLDKAGLP